MSRLNNLDSKDSLLLAFLIAAISAVFFNWSFLTIILLILVVGRILLARSSKLLICAFVISGCFLVRFIYFQTSFVKKTLPDQDQAHLHLRLFADEVVVDGDQLKAKAYDLAHKQKILLYATIGSEQEKHFWENNAKNLDCLLTGSVAKPMLPTNFEQFNLRAYFRTQAISNQISQGAFHRIQEFHGKGPFQIMIAATHTVRKKLIDYLERLPSPLSDYAKALLIGDLDNDFYDRYPGVTSLGLIHLFSISGFQVSYFALLLRKILRKICLSKEHNLLVTAASLPFFFVFAGGVQSLIRPVAAFELSLTAHFMKLRLTKETIWAGALLVGIFLSPMILFNIGGQLSYLLSFALLYTNRLGKLKTSLLMSLVSMPIILAAKFSWHMLSMPANFLAIPIFGTIILPLILLAMICQIFFPFLLSSCNAAIQLFAGAVEWTSFLPGQFYFGKLADFLVFPLICLIFLIFDRKKGLRHLAILTTALIISVNFACIHFPKEGELMTFDIGQGDAAFLRTPRNRQAILIDTGGKVAFPKKAWQIAKNHSNQGKGIIVNYIQSKGIGRLDYLILSHGDMDHIGNAKDILSLMPVNNILMPAGMLHTRAFKEQLQPFIKKGTQVIEVTDTNRLEKLPLQILHPFESGEAKNEDSIALYAALGPLKFFSAGDLPKEGEQEIAKKFPSLRADLIKLGHHGSNTSSDSNVLKNWKTSYGLISAGRNNRYGHPKKEVMSLMKKMRIHTFNTQTNGAIRFRYTKNKGFFETFTRNFHDAK